MFGSPTATTVAESVPAIGAPWGSLASATTVLTMAPASMSGWVTVYVQVYVQVSPTSRTPGFTSSPDGKTGVHRGSVTPTSVRLTLPSLSTVTVYVISWPALETMNVDGLFTTVMCGAVATTTVVESVPVTASSC